MAIRPVIGIPTYAEDAKFGLVDTFAAVLPLSYVHAIHESGGRAVLITPDDPDVDILDRLDGVMFAGGSDIDPTAYGETPHPTVTVVRPERDAAEMLLMRAALDRGLPMLAICRGMQMLAVCYGGSLHQHLPDVLGHDRHRPTRGEKFGHHPVRFAAGSRCQAILGDEVTVNSLHHQGVRDVGGLVPTGWCPGDDLVEAVEDPTKRFVVGVQWHPEDTDDFRLFGALVAAAGSRWVAPQARTGIQQPGPGPRDPQVRTAAQQPRPGAREVHAAAQQPRPGAREVRDGAQRALGAGRETEISLSRSSRA